MGSIPQSRMRSDSRVRMCGKLGLKVSVMGRGNRGLRTRRDARPQVLTAALFGQPAFETARTDREGGEHLLARHATRDGCQHAFPEIKRVTTHDHQYRTRS